MGVVYAAFDPDLERRVAVKVLPDGSAHHAARERLLREARAMARLAHPNVVHVYEVGSAGARDFVAMELVDGDTLAHWLRAARRDRADIVAAFLAAGAGLAAAHAAGVVHRDFKPHNVLRWRDGRVQVVDFGLARGVGEIESSFVGTPAYMAPEQWRGVPVGPAADQFAFCVAVWEALAGVRPFDGTSEEIRAAVVRGPASLDDRAVPSGLRAVLRRGLAVDPDARFPTMDALLAAIARTRRKRALPIALGVAAVGAAIALVLATRGGRAACPDPAIDPDVAWPADAEARLVAKGQGPVARVIAADVASWKSIRVGACAAEPEARAPRLACLDAVMSTVAAVARGAELSDRPGVDPGGLIEPSACATTPPRLVPPSPLTQELIAAVMRESAVPGQAPEARWRAYLPRAKDDPCALAAIDQLLSRHATSLDGERALLDEADSAAQRCGDDEMIASVALESAKLEATAQSADGRVAARLARADAAVSHLPTADERAELEVAHFLDDNAHGRFAIALAHAEAAVDGFASRHRTAYALELEIDALDLRRVRGSPEDVEVIPARFAKYHALGVADLGADHEWVRKLDRAIASWTFLRGDIAGAHVLFERAYRPFSNGDHVQRVTGTVVDASGAPVAGAHVTIGAELVCDRLGVIPGDDSLRRATTDAAGRFAVADAVREGAVVADLGDLQSSARAVSPDPIRLVLAPIARVEGQVELHGIAPNRVALFAQPVDQASGVSFFFSAPIDPSGRFMLERVPRGKLRITASWVAGTTVDQHSQTAIEVDVVGAQLRDAHLELTTSGRTINILVRSTISTPVPRAAVVVYPGRVQVANMRELQTFAERSRSAWARKLDVEASAAVRARAGSGDLYAPISSAPEGEATACAIGYPADEVDDAALVKKIGEHPERIEVRCVPVAAGDEVVIIEVPPFPRLD